MARVLDGGFNSSGATRTRGLGPEDPDTWDTLLSLAGFERAWGRYRAAEPVLQQIVERARRRLGPDHPRTLGYLDSLLTTHTRVR